MNQARLAVDIGQYSIAGRKLRNDDSYGVLCPNNHLLESKGIVAAIADGVSISKAAKQASEMAVRSLLDDYPATHESWSVKQSVATVLKSTNNWLYAQSQKQDADDGGMATTLSCLVLKGGIAHLFHAGDTRIWRLRGTKVEQLTTDHRLRLGGGRDNLSRALGLDARLEVDSRQEKLERGDTFIFTCDGVHDHVATPVMVNKIAETETLDDAARAIVDAASESGSEDNLTCQIIRVKEVGMPGTDAKALDAAELAFPKLLRAGDILDGYEVQRLLAESSRSQVYLAREQTSGVLVAIKTPSPNFEDDETYIAAFAREEWVGRMVHSPQVLKSLENKGRRSALYHVMEYFEGQTLDQWLHDNPGPDLPKVRAIVSQVASGLRALHRKGFLHLDLKPGNILINAAGTVKLIDFGSIQTAELDAESNVTAAPHGGTKDYSAPELLSGQRPGNLADLYSLGAVTYELLTGALPYGQGFAKPSDQRRLSYISARLKNGSIPLWVDAALKQAVEKSPERRTETLSGFIANIETPNPELGFDAFKPLLERDPVRFWQLVSLLLALAVSYLLFRLAHP